MVAAKRILPVSLAVRLQGCEHDVRLGEQLSGGGSTVGGASRIKQGRLRRPDDSDGCLRVLAAGTSYALDSLPGPLPHRGVAGHVTRIFLFERVCLVHASVKVPLDWIGHPEQALH